MRGVGVNPLRGQNNVQGSCDMGSFPHELPGYRHISNDAVRAEFEAEWGVKLDPEPGLRIHNMFDAAVDGTFKGLYVQGEDILQSDPDTKHVSAGLAAMELVVVQDLFLVETANYAHVFLPGCTFLEKDGTFTNAERRIQRVRKVMSPKNGYGDWEITQLIANAMGSWLEIHASQRDHGRDRAADAEFRGRVLRQARRGRFGAVALQRRAPARRADHAHRHLRARARASSSSPNMSRPTSGRGRVSRCFSPPGASCRNIMSARRRGAPRTANGIRRTCSTSIRTTPRIAVSRTAIGCACKAAPATPRCAPRSAIGWQPGVVYTTFHHPTTQANVITTDNSDWATNCPEYKVTAVQISPSNGPTDWQEQYRELSEASRRIANRIDAAE